MFIAALDATTGAATSWNPGADNEVYTVAVSGSTIYAGGFFGVMGNQPCSCIAAIDAASGAVTAFNPSLNGPVYGIAVLGQGSMPAEPLALPAHREGQVSPPSIRPQAAPRRGHPS